ncbi:cilia- and flagella-associated protein 251-like [Glandiceps talaboti]
MADDEQKASEEAVAQQEGAGEVTEDNQQQGETVENGEGEQVQESGQGEGETDTTAQVGDGEGAGETQEGKAEEAKDSDEKNDDETVKETQQENTEQTGESAKDGEQATPKDETVDQPEAAETEEQPQAETTEQAAETTEEQPEAGTGEQPQETADATDQPTEVGDKPAEPTDATEQPTDEQPPADTTEPSQDPEVAEGGVEVSEEKQTETVEPAQGQGEAAPEPTQESQPGEPPAEKPTAEQDDSQMQVPATTPAVFDMDVEEKSATPAKGAEIPEAPMEPEIESVKSEEPGPNALNLVWSFGVNRNVPVINLTDDQRKAVLYTCAHTAVVYDYANNSQRLLQGHCNNISCTCVSEDKRWIATADKGPNSCVIVWDSYTGIPVQTLFDAHPDGGVVSMRMTPDAKYLATLSANAKQQTLAIWDWTTECETPLCTAGLDESYGLQHYVMFNPEDTTQIVTNSESQVIFYAWKNGQLEYFAPSLTDQDFNRAVGNYSQSIFVSCSTKAYTATSAGNIVVWDNNRPISGPISLEPSPNKKAFKLVRLQERGITVVTTTDNYVVTADVLGHVKFYDWHLRMSNWYSDFDVGPINALSFEYIPEFSHEAGYDSDFPPDATIAARPFVTRDYTIGTSTALIAHVVADGTKVKVIHREHDAAIHAIAAHPTKPFVCIGSYAGYLKVWNYKTKEVVTSRMFPRGAHIRCIGYDPAGCYLAIGFTNGCVRIVDAITLEEECPEPFRFSRDAVTHCAFSHDSMWLATADADYCVTVYKAQPRSVDEPWIYLGKQRAHYKPIRGVMFGTALDSDSPRLLSVGEDRTLVEYDIFNSNTDDLRLISSDRIEQSAIPQCFALYPPITKENFLLLANDQFKFKLYNSTTKMCRKTILGPTYGSPLQRMEVLPTEGAVTEDRYLAYITKDKVGLHIMPLDGNPHNSMALIAHPGQVANLACSYDGKHVFTAGGTDAAVHMWNVNIPVLEAGAKLGGEDLIPFYGLLEGGRQGELFAELEDYFYYAQIRSQGVDTMDSRKVSTKIILSEVPFVMRALGFYPSEQEIEDMLNEVKFSNYVETGKYVTEIDLGEFIRLYVNHRPAFGLSTDQLQRAFEILGVLDNNGTPAIDRGELLDLLQSKGEHMTETELAEYLTTLLGCNPEGGSSELGRYDPDHAGDVIEDELPENITADMFADEVLGFGYAPEESPAPQSAGNASKAQIMAMP